MKITLICGHYLPKLGYIEVHLARALADCGHEVSVVTTSAVPGYVAHLHSPMKAGEEMDGKVKVLRLTPQFELGQVVIAKGVKEAVLSQQPNLIIVIGLGKRFPKPVFALNIPAITLFGDNLHSYAATTFAERLKTKLQFNLLKSSTYKAAIDKSAALVAYTPESFEAAGSMLGARFRKKLVEQNRFISLGFDPAQFYFDPVLRQKMRSEYGLTDSHRVLITSTRVVPEKALEAVLQPMAALPAHWHWWVVGSDDSAYAKNFESAALAALGPTRFRLFPYQTRETLNGFYNAADVALYTVPAISVFEVLGAGLPCILPPAKSLRHINVDPFLAATWEYRNGTPLNHAIEQHNYAESSRDMRARQARERFSWSAIAAQVLEFWEKGTPADPKKGSAGAKGTSD